MPRPTNDESFEIIRNQILITVRRYNHNKVQVLINQISNLPPDKMYRMYDVGEYDRRLENQFQF